MKRSAQKSSFNGEAAIVLVAGNYEAVLLPEIGGNLIAFRDTSNGYRFLREPAGDEMDSFKARPIVHGIPVLFPPNRFEDGKFPWQGEVHQLPINEEERNNHLHGFLHNVPWQVENYGVTEHESYATVAVKVDETHPSYRHFPFCYTVRLHYRLGELGLSQTVTVRNDGEAELPCLLAFHTAINAPFAPGSRAQDCKVKLTIGERWEMSERMLPTGRYQPLTAEEQALAGEGVYPFFAEMDNHYTAKPQNGRNRMELHDSKAGVTLVYDVGTSYKQWMIWNNFGNEGFFCPEPQINLVNAPNVAMAAEEIGLYSLRAGELWESCSRIYVK